ncbi:MAG: Uma2 family endonuclease [Isosphaerales bacterium]
MSVTQVVSPPQLGPASAGVLMTPEEFDAVEEWDDEYRYELIHGVLVVSPPPLEQEADPNEVLGYLLRRYRDDHPQGSALDKTLPERFIRTETSRRRADRVIWAGLGRRPEPKLDVPTIVAEFVSEGKRNYKRDYEEKRREYLEIGVLEYWVIDRFQRTMSVFRNQPGEPPMRVVAATETYQTPLLPGFELPLAMLLAAADEWEETN